MFRRVAATLSRVAAGAGAVQLGAAAVALTDKELGKKPEWYQAAVRSLEDSLKKLGKYGYIESPGQLAELEEPLQKVAEFHNVDIQWRIARILVEKAELSKCAKEKAHLLHEAKDHVKKALAVEPSSGSAGAHKWYAITLSKLEALEKHDYSEEILKHLEKATSIDAKDPYALHLLGVAQYNLKDYKNAIASFEKAEKIKAGFSSANLYYLGLAQKGNGNKDQAIKTLKQALETPAKYGNDGKARSQAKAVLIGFGLKSEEYEVKDL